MRFIKQHHAKASQSVSFVAVPPAYPRPPRSPPPPSQRTAPLPSVNTSSTEYSLALSSGSGFSISLVRLVSPSTQCDLWCSPTGRDCDRQSGGGWGEGWGVGFCQPSSYLCPRSLPEHKGSLLHSVQSLWGNYLSSGKVPLGQKSAPHSVQSLWGNYLSSGKVPLGEKSAPCCQVSATSRSLLTQDQAHIAVGGREHIISLIYF